MLGVRVQIWCLAILDLALDMPNPNPNSRTDKRGESVRVIHAVTLDVGVIVGGIGVILGVRVQI